MKISTASSEMGYAIASTNGSPACMRTFAKLLLVLAYAVLADSQALMIAPLTPLLSNSFAISAPVLLSLRQFVGLDMLGLLNNRQATLSLSIIPCMSKW